MTIPRVEHYSTPIIIPVKLFLDLPRDPVFPRRLSDTEPIRCHEFYPRGQLSRFPRNATRLLRIDHKTKCWNLWKVVSAYVLWTNASLKCLYHETQIGKESFGRILICLEPNCAEIMQEYYIVAGKKLAHPRCKNLSPTRVT